MRLEVHDDEAGNTHAATVKNIDYDYMAEQWVQDLTTDEANLATPLAHSLARMVLLDDAGIRAEMHHPTRMVMPSW